MNYPKTIQNLIECYKKLPGIGGKTAERLALASMQLDDELIALFSESLVGVKTGTYHGTYHVLDGLISPLDGVNPEDIHIDSLLDRIKKENIKEVILALKPSIEGETTSLYISKKLEKENVIITKIAHGIPLGADMEYIDSLTLGMALEDRKPIS